MSGSVIVEAALRLAGIAHAMDRPEWLDTAAAIPRDCVGRPPRPHPGGAVRSSQGVAGGGPWLRGNRPGPRLRRGASLPFGATLRGSPAGAGGGGAFPAPLDPPSGEAVGAQAGMECTILSIRTTAVPSIVAAQTPCVPARSGRFRSCPQLCPNKERTTFRRRGFCSSPGNPKVATGCPIRRPSTCSRGIARLGRPHARAPYRLAPSS